MKNILECIKNETLHLSDNVAINQSLTEDLIMEAKASLLIHANLNSSSWNYFYNGTIYSKLTVNEMGIPQPCYNDKTYKLNEPITLRHKDRYEEVDIEYTHFYCCYNASKTGYIRNQFYLDKGYGWHSAISPTNVEIISGRFPDTAFELFKNISKGNTPDAVCRYFGEVGKPWTKFVSLRGKYKQHLYYEKINLISQWFLTLTNIPGNLPTILANQNLTTLIPSGIHQGDLITGYCNFYNEYDECTLCVAVIYDFFRKTKYYLPITPWVEKNTSTTWFCTLPVNADKQPLLNLNRICSDSVHSALLTLDLQLATKNTICQGWSWTSVFDVKNFDNNDWEPLKSLEQICILIHPHHGMTFEESVLKYHKFAVYLEEKEGFDNLKFILMDMHYTDAKDINSFNDLMTYQSQVNDDSVADLTRDEFEELYNKAQERLGIKSIWSNDTQVVDNNSHAPASVVSNKMDYVIFPCIAKGESTILMAPKSTGKSNLAFSLATLAIDNSKRSNKMFMEQGFGSPKKSFKVLYLDCENSEITINKKIKSFVEPLLVKDKVKHDQCLKNFIIKSLRENRIDYTLPENHDKIINLIHDALNEGNVGQAVDLVVIDPVTKFIGTESNQSANNLSKLLEKLRSMNVATLLVAHTASDGSVVGFKSKQYDSYWVLKAEKLGTGNMEIPVQISHVYQRDDLPNELLQPFKINFKDKRWNIVEPQLTLGHTWKLIKEYFKGEHKVDELANILGVSRSNFMDTVSDKK